MENEELIEKIKTHLSKAGTEQDTDSNVSDMVRKEFGSTRNYFGQFLIDNGFISEEDLLEALTKQKETGKMLGDTLVEMGLLEEKELVTALSEQKGYGIADDKMFSNITEDVLMRIPMDFAQQHCLIPLEKDRVIEVYLYFDPDLARTSSLEQDLKDFAILSELSRPFLRLNRFLSVMAKRDPEFARSLEQEPFMVEILELGVRNEFYGCVLEYRPFVKVLLPEM